MVKWTVYLVSSNSAEIYNTSTTTMHVCCMLSTGIAPNKKGVQSYKVKVLTGGVRQLSNCTNHMQLSVRNK